VRCDWLANRRIAEVLRGALAVRCSPFGGWRHTALTITLTPNLNPFRPWCPLLLSIKILFSCKGFSEKSFASLINRARARAQSSRSVERSAALCLRDEILFRVRGSRAFTGGRLGARRILPSSPPSTLPPFHPSTLPFFHSSTLPPFHPSTLPSSLTSRWSEVWFWCSDNGRHEPFQWL